MILPVVQPSAPPAAFETGPASIAAVKVLRVSLTDRCNFRCVYCMPAEGVAWLPKQELLSFEEILQVVRAAARRHGIRRIKLTGGEPTVRRDLVELVHWLRQSGEVHDLSMTTNGALLEALALPLARAGLDRVTISLDSLNPARFRAITRTGDLASVLRGIEAAEQAGLKQTKLNCVVMRGINDDEVVDFAALTLRRRLTVRFIEYMPLGDSALLQGTSGPVDPSERGPAGGCGAQERGPEVFVAESETRARIEQALGGLQPVAPHHEAGVGPARVFRLNRLDALGRIGFISAMSRPFCATCNRLRLTATGILRSCLFEGGEVDLKPILRGLSPTPDALLAEAMTRCVRLKPAVHSARGHEPMSRVGG